METIPPRGALPAEPTDGPRRAEGTAPVPYDAQRTRGALHLAYRHTAGRTRLAGAYRQGAARFLEPIAGGPVAEGVLINTAGGVTGGDRFDVAVEVDAGAAALLTTQAAEKIYRAAPDDPPARIETRVTLSDGARLAWLPQPTILFDRARLHRRITIEMAPTARCLALEAVILGRTAMGETVRDLDFEDAWRIRRGGGLVFADTTRLDTGALAAADGPAMLGRARAFALLVLVGADAADRLEPARAALEDAPALAGASTFSGLLSIRILAEDGLALDRALRRVVPVLDPGGVPHMWSI